jgi:hypothetical protein
MHTDLGPLAPLAAVAVEWRSRSTAGGMTWAGLYTIDRHADVIALVRQHTCALDQAAIRQLATAGHLPGVRSFAHLIAILVPPTTAPAAGEPVDSSCVDSTTEDHAEPPAGIPIFDHGELAQARISEVRQAVHLMRYLDDYHEPTLAALKRRLVRRVQGDDPEALALAAEQAAEQFLEHPIYWRGVVELAVYHATVRAIEGVLGARLSGPGRTPAELQTKIGAGIAALALAGAHEQLHQIAAAHDARYTRLQAARVVLLYDEHAYLHLLGVVDGRSMRRHLPRGLHLIFSDQQHRRADRTAHLWLAASAPHDQAGAYYFASQIPPAYAAKKPRPAFRLSDAAAVRRYVKRSPAE